MQYLAFTTPLALKTRCAPQNKVRSTSVCVLDQDRPVKKAPSIEKNSSSAKQIELTSPFYKAVPKETSAKELPQRPPEHRGIPMFGFIIEHWLGGSSWKRAQKYGKIYHSNILLEPMHFVTNMDTIVDIQKNPDMFTSRDQFEASAAIFGENSMIMTDGVDHAILRNTVAPAFSPKLFPFFFHTIRSRTEKTWAQVERDVAANGKIKLDPVFRRNYLSIIVELTTGIDMESDRASFLLEKFFHVTKAFFSPPFGPIWDKAMKSRDTLLQLLKDVICSNLAEKKETIEKLREYGENLSYKGSRDIKKGDVNVLLIAMAKSGLSTDPDTEPDSEQVSSLADLMFLLWFAGYATSATTTACAAFEMGMDRGIWARLAAEQGALTTAAGAAGVTYEQVSAQMPLLDSFVTEMLRLHPASGGALRVATGDVSVLGRHVRAGEKLFLDYVAAMRDPSVFPRPNEVVLDRFVRREGHPPPPRIVAFGPPGSPHYCLGAALAKILMKTTLAVLLRGYTLDMTPGQSTKYAVVPDDTPRSKVLVQNFKRRQ